MRTSGMRSVFYNTIYIAQFWAVRNTSVGPTHTSSARATTANLSSAISVMAPEAMISHGPGGYAQCAA